MAQNVSLRRYTKRFVSLVIGLLGVMIGFIVAAKLVADRYQQVGRLTVTFSDGVALLFIAFAAVGAVLTAYRGLKAQSDLAVAAEQRISAAEARAESAPERAKFAWDLARVKLEAYFDRNLSQVNQIFWVAVTVMFIGFAFVLWGVLLSLNQPTVTPTALVAGISGIISQFIGATFMVIYRSTMAQANQFMSILERINTVGMAVQVLDSIPESQIDLKNSTRAEIVSLLLSANIGAEATRSNGPK